MKKFHHLEFFVQKYKQDGCQEFQIEGNDYGEQEKSQEQSILPGNQETGNEKIDDPVAYPGSEQKDIQAVQKAVGITQVTVSEHEIRKSPCQDPERQVKAYPESSRFPV
jgi:secreted PhoX family phosphatase